MVRNCDRLSAEELWRFHNDGFVVPDCRLPQDMVAEMREAYDGYCQVDVERANLSRRADFLCSHRTAQVTSCQTMKARSRSSR